MNQNIIYTHCHKIDTDRIMSVKMKCELELRTYTVGTGNKYRFLVFLADFKKSAESANAAQHAFAHGTFGKRFDSLYQCIACVDIDTGIAIGKRLICG